MKNFNYTREVNNPYKVVILECERGWGSKVEDTLFFKTEKEAKDYVSEFNSENTSEVAPDWYMVANYMGKV